jgi:deoxyribodipyrimidine photo-lyase
MTAIVWFRHDLRIADNPALVKACDLKLGVLAVYIHCQSWVDKHYTAPIQLDFIRRHLLLLRQSLLEKNIPLKIYSVKKSGEIPSLLLKIANQYQSGNLFFNAEYPVDELQRDTQVNQLLTAKGIQVKRCHDRVIIPPGMIVNGQGDAYKVFTAFKNKWLQTIMPLTSTGQAMQPLSAPRKLQELAAEPDADDDINKIFKKHHLRDSSLWPAGEKIAHKKLMQFIENKITHYQHDRDFPAIDGTSSLSPYLALGVISPRQAIDKVLQFTRGEWEGTNAGAACWISEIIWREFYQHIVVSFPHVCKRKPMQSYTDTFPWKTDKHLLNAWCEGKTGIPIVDAAIRQLLATGWMHNRLRMVVAMFLTKNLQIDWRLGEAFFMQHLIDGDFAANNGGWQWSASTGTDAAPYFRIFNPVSQSEKFDPEGMFIRHWLPELSHLSQKTIHNPGAGDYLEPIVDLSESRKSTIALFAAIQSHKNL